MKVVNDLKTNEGVTRAGCVCSDGQAKQGPF